MTTLDDQLRTAFTDLAADIPASVGDRVRGTDFHPRTSRVPGIAGVGALAAVGAGALALTTVGGSTTHPAPAPHLTPTAQVQAALAAASSDVFHVTWAASGDEPKGERWGSGDDLHVRVYDLAGTVTEDVGFTGSGTVTTTDVLYASHSYTVSTETLPTVSGTPGQQPGIGIAKNVASAPTAAEISQLLASGDFTKSGSGATYTLTGRSGDITVTIPVDASTNLPSGISFTGGGAGFHASIEWLPPTAANEALTTVTPPAGFTKQ